jgi:hypothetical protein
MGLRPPWIVKRAYKWTYLYAAVEPTSGESFCMYLPGMDEGCLELFLEELSKRYPDQLVALAGDPLLRILLAGLVGGRRQSQVGSHQAALGEPLRILQGQDKRKSRQRSHSWHLPQKSRLRITLCGQLLYAPVIILDLLGERANGLYYGPEDLGELGG